jgi:Zn-dependent peptidase ImmA (M78 family)
MRAQVATRRGDVTDWDTRSTLLVGTYADHVPGTVRQAEREAAALLNSWWTSTSRDEPIPVDPYALAQRLGIHVREAVLPADESGHIEFRPQDEAVITINRGDHLNRRRFTCAHEIGHYVRREVTGPRRRMVDYRGTLAGLGTDIEEIFANQFAAALLMPSHLVERWQHLGSPEMARRFGTSVQAMDLRLRNLGLA